MKLKVPVGSSSCLGAGIERNLPCLYHTCVTDMQMQALYIILFGLLIVDRALRTHRPFATCARHPLPSSLCPLPASLCCPPGSPRRSFSFPCWPARFHVLSLSFFLKLAFLAVPTVGDRSFCTSPCSCGGGGDGAFYDQHAGSCALCPPGFFCTSSDPLYSSGNPCPAGKYSGLGQKECLSYCRAGTYKIASACNSCPAGKYNPGRSGGAAAYSYCLSCPAGYYCAGGPMYYDNVQAITCVAGKYSADGAISCSNCAAGTYNSEKAQTSCAPCTSGSYSTIGALSCVYTSTSCPVGTFAIAPSSCSACPTGKFNPSTGASSGLMCFECDAGTFGATTGLSSASCTGTCSAGFYCPAGSSSATQNVCLAGTWSSPGAASCIPCAAGRFSASLSATDKASCASCPAGSFCPAGSAFPKECLGWTYGNLTGQAACGACPPNTFCNGRSSVPCASDGRCASAGCGSGYKGVLCSDCSTGFFKAFYSSSEIADTAIVGSSYFCQACASGFSPMTISALALLALLVLLFLFAYLAKSREDILELLKDSLLSLSFKCHLGFLVLLNSVSAIPFPSIFKTWLLSFAGLFAGLSTDFVRPECTIEWSVLHSWCVVTPMFFLCCSWLVMAKRRGWVLATRLALAATTFLAHVVFQRSLKAVVWTTVTGKRYLAYQLKLEWFVASTPIDHRIVCVVSAFIFAGLTVWFLLYPLICKQQVQGEPLEVLLTTLDTAHNALSILCACAIIWGPEAKLEASVTVLAGSFAELLFLLFVYKVEKFRAHMVGEFWLYVIAHVLTFFTVLLGLGSSLLDSVQNSDILGWIFLAINYLFLGNCIFWACKPRRGLLFLRRPATLTLI